MIPQSIRRYLFGRSSLKWWGIGLFAAAIFVLWPPSDVVEGQFFLPADTVGLPEGLTVARNKPFGIEIRVRGPASILAELSDLKLRYALDLSDAHPGFHSIPILADRIALPKGVELLSIEPAAIAVRVDEEIKRHVPVILVFTGMPATGYFITDARTNPAYVLMRGPKDLLINLEKIPTKPIEVAGLSEPLKRDIALDPPEGVQVLSPEEAVVRAEIDIKEKVVTRTFENVEVAGRDSTSDYVISPPVIQLEITGPVGLLDTLQEQSGLEVSIDLKGLKPGVYVRRASITLPVTASLVGADPELFTVTIK